MIEDLLVSFQKIFLHIQWSKIIVAAIFWFLGQALIQAVKVFYGLLAGEIKNRQRRFLVQKTLVYALNVILLVAILQFVGITMKTILGAAGILTVAIGFAARSSISNLISGVFLIFEQPFVVGDGIEVGEIKGEVLSVDLLSTKLRTLDNLLVRMPNDMIMASPMLNHTHFPICRMDMTLMLNYSESLAEVHKILNEVAESHQDALEEPEPLFQVQSFNENYIEVIFWVWTTQDKVMEFKGHFYKEVHRAFRKAGVTQPQASFKVSGSPVGLEPNK